MSQSGKLFKSSKGGSVFHDPKAKTISMDTQSREEIDDLLEAFTGGEPLPRLIFVGTNTGNYLFLAELEHLLQSVKVQRFHCSHCYARVAQGRFDPSVIEVIDRIVACRCMAVIFRKDIPSPRSGAEWASFRDLRLKGRVKHMAADADGRS